MEPSNAHTALDAVTDRAIVTLDPTGKVVLWSAGAQAVLGYSDTEAVGRPRSMFQTEDDRTGGMAERELAAAQESDCFEFEGWRVRKGGRHFRAGVTVNAIRDPAGSLTGFVEVIRDLASDQQRAHPLSFDPLETAPDAMVIVGPDGRIVLANAQTDRMFGYARADLIGNKVEILLPPRLRENHIGHRADFFASPELRQMGSGLNLWALRRDGTEFPVEISLSPLGIEASRYASVAIRDITVLREREQELIKKQRELERLVRIDTLTGLVNHAEGIARLEAALQDRRLPGSTHVGVLFCDADHFKAVNDTWGHTVGDLVLSTIAERFRDCVRDDDTVGRMGGDEILVLLPGVHGIDDVIRIAEKIRCCVAEPIHQLGDKIYVTVSIGATLAVAGESVTVLTNRVDAAMYKAKQAGRNTVTAI